MFSIFFRHDWYQTETHVIITVMIKNMKQENVAIEFQEKSVCSLVLVIKFEHLFMMRSENK